MQTQDNNRLLIGIPHTEDWQFLRLAAITSERGACDPWPGRHFPSSFHLSAAELLDRATQAPLKAPQPTVSGFAAWIYSLYLEESDAAVLKAGSEAETEILEARRDWTSYSEFRHFNFSSWHQVHCGMGSPGAEDKRRAFVIPGLLVNGQPLHANPDSLGHPQSPGRAIGGS